MVPYQFEPERESSSEIKKIQEMTRNWRVRRTNGAQTAIELRQQTGASAADTIEWRTREELASLKSRIASNYIF